jgi:hypothetical protein
LDKTMTRHLAILGGVLGIGLAAAAGPDETAKGMAVRLLLSEVQAGSMASEQYCTVVFEDRHFHYEKATRKMGEDRDRKVYEGELSQADWDTLTGILDSKEFRQLNVPQGVPPLVMEDVHTFTISVARGSKFQNMEFIDNKSRKPYDSQLKPLLQWWKLIRHERMTESKAAPDARCSLDSTHAVFSQ